MLTLSKQQALQLERLQLNPDFKYYQTIIESLKSESENQAFLNPKEAYEHLIARNVYDSVLNAPEKYIEETRERLRVQQTSDTASY
jgi:hypothetical protein